MARSSYALIVDDDDELRRALVRQLSAWLPCEAASTVEEALEFGRRPRRLIGALVDVGLGAPGAARDGIDEVATPLKLIHPRADVRIFTGQSRFEPAVARASARGFFTIVKGEADLSTVIGPGWAGLAAEQDETVNVALIEERLAAIDKSGRLTETQFLALGFAVRGKSYVEIGKALGVSRNAIYGLSDRIRRRTGKSLFELALEVCEGTGRQLRPPSDR